MKYIKELRTGTVVVLALGFASVAVAGASGSSDARSYLASGGQEPVHKVETPEPPPTPEEQAAKEKHKKEEQETGRHSKEQSTDQEPAATEGSTPAR